jgi:hypothetical protein
MLTRQKTTLDIRDLIDETKYKTVLTRQKTILVILYSINETYYAWQNLHKRGLKLRSQKLCL